MNILPLKFSELNEEDFIFCDDSGAYFVSTEAFLERYAEGFLQESDQQFLLDRGHAFRQEGDYRYFGYAARWARRQFKPGAMDYVIMVPTLRCNLACHYCQVSRANENARGVDWDDETLASTLTFLDTLVSPKIKIEFQGGEPLLRLDILNKVRRFCRDRFQEAQFIVCTNLQDVSEEAWDFLSAPDTLVSTSFDGDFSKHKQQRTFTDSATRTFQENLVHALETLGPAKVSVLPTIDPASPPSPRALISNFAALGIRSIYLRPVNHHGFARKRFKNNSDEWEKYYDDFIEELIRYNLNAEELIEEFYLTHCLRRVLQAGHHGHVDLRNPNFFGKDYVVVDYDGTFYPTDEARMLRRIGHIDLSIGSVRAGLDKQKIASMNANSLNNFNEDCIHCAFQPFCGTDIVDEISRYNRIDLPRHETYFCQRHMFIFKKIFSLIYRDDLATRRSLSAWLDVPNFDPSLAVRHI